MADFAMIIGTLISMRYQIKRWTKKHNAKMAHYC